jgi:hypothetical protein
MGLAVSVGVLAGKDNADPEGLDWLRAGFREVNRVLAAHGLPLHEEPESLPDIPNRGQLMSFPYSWLHYLRRAAAFARQAPDQFCPVAEGVDPAQDEMLDREYFVIMDSHLICHSDSEGFYVPIDFTEPLYDDQEEGLPGGILGSSQRALEEVRRTAPLLGIPLDDGDLCDDAARSIASEEDGSSAYWIERQVWLTMFEALRQSVEHKCAVAFG